MKQILFTLLLGCSIANYACAKNLTITNNTNNVFSFRINGQCSAAMGQIQPHSLTAITEKNMAEACEYNSIFCKALAYPNPDCQGNDVAEIIFDGRIGVRGVEYSKNGYKFSSGLFRLEINSV